MIFFGGIIAQKTIYHFADKCVMNHFTNSGKAESGNV